MRYLIIILLLACATVAQGQSLNLIKGSVSSGGNPLPGASIKVKSGKMLTQANAAGAFSILASAKDTLVITFLGYKIAERFVGNNQVINIQLQPNHNQLQEVVVSTGYQEIAKERATGSFVQVDQQLLNRSVSTGILDRLKDVVPGLSFNNVGTQISIRGQSTIFAKADPLIVIDNFPYDGELDNINPNDVESITVLKDAAAASIWGTRAGNGVIVIRSKSGKYNSRNKLTVNGVINIAKKPDLFYVPKMNVADVIEIEQRLFKEGAYQSVELSDDHPMLTPVVELLIAKRDKLISEADADAQIAALKNYDVRKDLKKYFYRNSVKQQYSAQLSGGSAAQRHFISLGYDKNLDAGIGDGYNRLTLNASNTYSLLKQKLELSTAIYYTESNRLSNFTGEPSTSSISYGIYPYARLADDQGNALPVARDYRSAFVNQAQQQGLLNWQYKPLEELHFTDNTRKISDYRINTQLKYTFTPALSLSALYQYNKSQTSRRELKSLESYYTRDIINRFTQKNTDGSLTRPVPLGGILNQGNSSSIGHNLRLLGAYQQQWQKHSVNAIAGTELKQLQSNSDNGRLYGYDQEHASSSVVDYLNDYPMFYNPARRQGITNIQSMQQLADRFISYFANASYSYLQRYTLSLSGRKDMSNLFGVNTNQKGVPLYSAGLSWNASSEPFYKLSWLPYLRVRATYGYNGNVDNGLSAFTTATYYNGATTTLRLPYADIQNPPNPELRWERVKMINLGIDFESKNSIIGGSIEYYHKNGIDLIGSSPFPPSSGITTFRGNTANTKGQGVDVSINTRNLNRALKWNSNILFSYVSDKVTRYLLTDGSVNSLLLYGSQGFPQLGKPLYGIYSYAWAGLNPQTGDPQGYLNGAVSTDYAKIIDGATTSNIKYNGASRPPLFGALRNTFGYKGFSASFNISYRFGYYFRRNSISYGNTYGSGGHADYYLRWQQPGDEAHTQVPSIPITPSNRRDNFYTYADVLVVKGDHIRFQDLRLAYDLDKGKIPNLPFGKVSLYLYASNLGIIWKANKQGIDPDNQTAAPIRSVAAGIKVEF